MSTPKASPEQGLKNQYSTINFLFNAINVALELGLQAEAKAIQQQKIAERMQEAAQLDPLTSLHNRRALAEDYARLQAGNTRRRRNEGDKHTNQPVAILLADIDKFKSINDTYGHPVGDMVIKEVAGTMRESVRRRDVVARWGGEEFALLLPRTSEENALKIAETIRGNVGASDILHEVDPDRKISVSIGLAIVNFNDPLELNLAKADLALYAAKELGRDRVVLTSQLPLVPQFQDVELIVAHPDK
jgi:diguanylate cyclase (GGDEF)-like protein